MKRICSKCKKEYNEFPDGFQVLCHNCNLAKGYYGECPHNSLKICQQKLK
jgi:hypothetical protein